MLNMNCRELKSEIPFSPKERTGTTSDPLSIAILMNPCRFFRTNSKTPGRACSDSSAPPMTIVIALPGPFFLLVSSIPIDNYTGAPRSFVD